MRGDLKPDKTDHITISIDKEILEQVKNTAKKQNLSINAVINKLIKDNVFFGQYFTDHVPVVISPKIFTFLVENVDEEIWIKSWEIAHREVTPSIYAMHNTDLSLDNYVRNIMSDVYVRVGVFDKYTCHQDKEGNYKLVASHKYGTKWSRVLARALSSMFEEKFGVRTKSQCSQNTLTIYIIK